MLMAALPASREARHRSIYAGGRVLPHHARLANVSSSRYASPRATPRRPTEIAGVDGRLHATCCGQCLGIVEALQRVSCRFRPGIERGDVAIEERSKIRHTTHASSWRQQVIGPRLAQGVVDPPEGAARNSLIGLVPGVGIEPTRTF